MNIVLKEKSKDLLKVLKAQKLELHIEYRQLADKFMQASSEVERTHIAAVMIENEFEQSLVFKKIMLLEDDNDFALDDYRNNQIARES